MVDPLGVLVSLKKNQLVKKGYCCGKTRRKPTQSQFLRSLETSGQVKTLIFLGFLFGLAGLIFYGSGHTVADANSQPAKQFLFGLLVFFTALAQLWINHPQTFAKNSRVVLMFGTLLAQLVIMKVLMVFIGNGTIERPIGGLLYPYALAPLVISALLGKNQGIYAAIFVSLWGATLSSLMDATFLAMSLISGFVAVFVTLQIRKRSQFLRAGFYVGLVTWLLAVSFGIISVYTMPFGPTDWTMVGYQTLTAIGTGLVTAVLVSGALPVLEQAFRITTPISWLEMTDLNHPLLMRLSLEAPGTYEHSQSVARLAEAAAERIGANAGMCRTCAYFHDIGKLVKPEYFTENMRTERNPHDELAPTMSALILIAHVKEGVDLALKHTLNPRIIEVIQQHHGNSVVRYFYNRALRQQEDAREESKRAHTHEDDIPEVHEENFRYSGPLPSSKESAIISLADAVESASRSLERPSPQRIEELVNEIVDDRVADHQLDDCDLTFHELREVVDSFCFTLSSMLHRRVAYPKKTAADTGAATATPEMAAAMREHRERERERTRALAAPAARARDLVTVPAVRLRNRQRSISLDLARLQTLATAAAAQCLNHPGPGKALFGGMEEVDVIVVSDRVIARVHRQFMNIPGATDVITFGHGEIVLSASTAARQAREHGETPDREAARYIVHGLLHLNGHEDADTAKAALMWQAQEHILQSLWPVDAA